MTVRHNINIAKRLSVEENSQIKTAHMHRLYGSIQTAWADLASEKRDGDDLCAVQSLGVSDDILSFFLQIRNP